MFGPLIVKSGASKNNKTGSWRVEARPSFLKKNCIACKMCVLACPEGCISGAEKNTFDCNLIYCKGCGNCVAVCPKQDIVMIKEDVKE